MPYLVNIPQPTDNLSVSQGNMLGNFQQLQTSFSVNHVPLTTAINNGKHIFLQIPSLGNNPTLPPLLAIGDGTLYTNNISASDEKTELFYTPDAGELAYQMTRTSTTSYPSFANNTNYETASDGTQLGGWTFLPGGLLLNYGFEVLSGSGSIPFPRAFNNPPYSIQLTLIANHSTNSVNTVFIISPVNASSFNWGYTGTTSYTSFYWMAIGS
jgi:hypothetical protein